ncbi:MULTISPECIES: right-handed parallel beta-helix repeat-containing protein [unclassified Novosphingobium]|uniref:right-handed parallel beta-helix repeat-containing protein n=1 Tax=unclassified Novosphingobium TaxID=2644732 RepID=UPI0025D724D2|nr:MULTISPECIES: right-handed parallel beta-helix repeat-containing protein [unclassified Novosphingobium]HQS68484.1 right-handed parallel beta-helix repeat-containing protein [Novosphingobium sp.]
MRMKNPFALRVRRHNGQRLATLMLGVAVVAAIPASALLAQGQGQRMPYKVIETGRSFAALQEAVNSIGEGSGTVQIEPGVYRDCAVQGAGDVGFVAQVPGQTVFDGAACEGKATLVVRGRSTRVEGLIFQNVRVPDANGAGIRLERGNLTVRQSWFRDSEQGILSANDPTGAVLIEQSTFTRLGRCDRGLSCAHSIYLGDYGSLTVRRTRFEAGRGGHYVKTRAARVDISQSSFDDSAGKTTNYMIDLSAGAAGRIVDNAFVQGADKENHSAFIAVAAEGRANSSSGLLVSGNDARFAPGVPWGSVFVADWSGDTLSIGTNALGKGLTKFEKR